MSLAAVLDPVTKDAAVVFYYSQKQKQYNLANKLFSLSGGANSEFKDLNTSNSYSTPSSPLVAANFLGSTRVFGVASIPKLAADAEKKANVVVQLSPVFNPVDEPNEDRVQVPALVPLAVTETIDHGTTTGFVFYITKIDDDRSVASYTVTRDSSSFNSIGPSLHKDSKIAACSLDGQPHIFYQNSEKTLVHRSHFDGDIMNVSNAESMALGSHLATIVVGGRFHVYFRNNDNKLVRTHGVVHSWATAEVVSSFQVNADSYIGLVAHETTAGEVMIHHFFWSKENIIHDSKPAGKA